MKLFNIFKKKEVNWIDKEVKNYKKKDRKRLRALWEQWKSGNYLKINSK